MDATFQGSCKPPWLKASAQSSMPAPARAADGRWAHSCLPRFRSHHSAVLPGVTGYAPGVALHSSAQTLTPNPLPGVMAARVQDREAGEAASMPAAQMQIVTNAAAMRRFSRQHRAAGRTLALVPTMVGPESQLTQMIGGRGHAPSWLCRSAGESACGAHSACGRRQVLALLDCMRCSSSDW